MVGPDRGVSNVIRYITDTSLGTHLLLDYQDYFDTSEVLPRLLDTCSEVPAQQVPSLLPLFASGPHGEQ